MALGPAPDGSALLGCHLANCLSMRCLVVEVLPVVPSGRIRDRFFIERCRRIPWVDAMAFASVYSSKFTTRGCEKVAAVAVDKISIIPDFDGGSRAPGSRLPNAGGGGHGI